MGWSDDVLLNVKKDELTEGLADITSLSRDGDE